MSGFDDDLRLAHVLGDQADSVTTRRFKALDLSVETKPDMTPVTDADKAVEDLLRTTLSRSRPRDAVIGEEYGSGAGSGGGRRRWVIDPIDGTKNFVRGVPVWATLIALMDEDQVVVGMITAPALGRRWWASRGSGAFTGRSLSQATRCHVSSVPTIGSASLSYGSVISWEEHGRLDAFLDLCRACWRTRAFGDFWSYMMVAEGAVDVTAEPEVSLWDLAAPALIVEEAGGRFTDLYGAPGPDGGSGAASNGLLHDELLFYLTGQ
jgi:histidinol-phosphatase